MESDKGGSIKLYVVGDGNVGKTCMLYSFICEKFLTEYNPTLFDNYTSKVKVNDIEYTLDLWDIPGQEDYKKLTAMICPGTNIFLICFSVTEKASLENALKTWYPELEEKAKNVPKIFVGTKIDLRNDSNKDHILKANAERLAAERNCKYKECSALTQEGLKEVFYEATKTFLLKTKNPSAPKPFCVLI